jgi:hypothetical protein
LRKRRVGYLQAHIGLIRRAHDIAGICPQRGKMRILPVGRNADKLLEAQAPIRHPGAVSRMPGDDFLIGKNPDFAAPRKVLLSRDIRLRIPVKRQEQYLAFVVSCGHGVVPAEGHQGAYVSAMGMHGTAYRRPGHPLDRSGGRCGTSAALQAKDRKEQKNARGRAQARTSPTVQS